MPDVTNYVNVFTGGQFAMKDLNPITTSSSSPSTTDDLKTIYINGFGPNILDWYALSSGNLYGTAIIDDSYDIRPLENTTLIKAGSLVINGSVEKARNYINSEGVTIPCFSDGSYDIDMQTSSDYIYIKWVNSRYTLISNDRISLKYY